MLRRAALLLLVLLPERIAMATPADDGSDPGAEVVDAETAETDPVLHDPALRKLLRQRAPAKDILTRLEEISGR